LGENGGVVAVTVTTFHSATVAAGFVFAEAGAVVAFVALAFVPLIAAVACACWDSMRVLTVSCGGAELS
jgi:hypothetical protein